MVSWTTNAKVIGQWSHYIAYNDVTDVVPVGKNVFAVAGGALMWLNTGDNSVRALNSTNLLNENDSVKHICWNATAKSIIITYNTGSIDILEPSTEAVYNLSYIKKDVSSNSKTIQSINVDGKYVYLSMEYGIIVVDAVKHEMPETYLLYKNITGTTVKDGKIYAKTKENEVIEADLKANLVDRNVWKTVTDESVKKTIIDKIYEETVVARKITDNNLYILDSSNKCYWGNDTEKHLVKYEKRNEDYYIIAGPYRPLGPYFNKFYNIYWKYDHLYCVSGGWRRRYDPSIDNGGEGHVQVMDKDGNWVLYEEPSETQTGGIDYVGLSDIAIDPRNNNHVMVGAKAGIYEFLNGKFVKRYNKDNSPIKANHDGNNPDYQMVLGLTYDNSGNLWVLNSYSSNGVLKLNNSGSWELIRFEYTDGWSPHERFLTNIKMDSRGNLWFINHNIYEKGFFIVQPSNSNAMKRFLASYNQDGTPLYTDGSSDFIQDLCIDKEENIWIAGRIGVEYLPYKEITTISDGMVYQHKVNRDDGSGLADYMMGTSRCTCITTDGANRKYIGTQDDGIYVFSADNNTLLQHYTKDNSSLLSNIIRYIAIDENTGEVYISTDRGLCSVTTDGVTAPTTLDKDNIKVYPNPVTPEYNGLITIQGVTVGAEIKIATATGRIVHEGRTSSAVYRWNGLDSDGNRCASGVYNILVASSDGNDGVVAKVAIVK